MNRMSWLKIFTMGAIAFGFAGATRAADIVIGDFETGVDGFGTAGGDASFNGDPPAYAQSTAFGVTLNTHSLAATQNINGGGSPHFDGAASPNIIPLVGLANLSNPTQALTISYDETFISTQLFQTKDAGDPNPPSFAKTDELIWTIFGSGGSLGTATINNHGQKTVAQGQATDSAATGTARGGWNGTDHTSHMTWNLNTFTITDPTDSVTKTYQAFFAAHPDVTFTSIFQFALGSGDNTANANGFGTFFFDNIVVHTVPEPTTVALLGMGLPALAMRRRRA